MAHIQSDRRPDGQTHRQEQITYLPLQNFCFAYMRGKKGNTTNPMKFLPLPLLRLKDQPGWWHPLKNISLLA